MMLRDRGGPLLAGQALISPVLDFTRWRAGGEDAPPLTGGEMEYYTACYCPLPEQAAHPYVSPLLSGRFHALPPAYVMARSWTRCGSTASGTPSTCAATGCRSSTSWSPGWCTPRCAPGG
jgi:acetyl esterase/lipase